MTDRVVVTWDDAALRLEEQMVALAAYGLAGSVRELVPGPFASHEWFVLLREAQARGLVGMLAAAAHDGALKLSTAQSEELAIVERETAGLTLLTEQRVLRTSGVLSAAGHTHRVLGGPPRARLGYRDLALRHYRSAVVLTTSVGAGLVDGLTRVPVAGRGVDVGVRTAVRSAGITTDLVRAAGPPVTFELAGQVIPTAGVEEHLVLACLDLRLPEGARGPRVTAPVSGAASKPKAPSAPGAGVIPASYPGSGSGSAGDPPAGRTGPAGPAGPAGGQSHAGHGGHGGYGTHGDSDDGELAERGELLAQRDVAELALAPAVDAARVRQVAERWEVTDEVTRALVDTWHRFELADRTPLSVWAERREEPPPASGGVAVRRHRRRRRWSRLVSRRAR